MSRGGSRIVHHELQHFQVGQGRAALSSSVSAETMLCFACGEIRYKKQWSARQWDKAMQLVKGLDQWKRNCCKQCSDVPGWCFNSKLELSEMSLEELQNFSSLIEQDVFDVLTLEGSVAARNHQGGTAPEQVKAAADRALKLVKSQS